MLGTQWPLTLLQHTLCTATAKPIKVQTKRLPPALAPSHQNTLPRHRFPNASAANRIPYNFGFGNEKQWEYKYTYSINNDILRSASNNHTYCIIAKRDTQNQINTYASGIDEHNGFFVIRLLAL